MAVTARAAELSPHMRAQLLHAPKRAWLPPGWRGGLLAPLMGGDSAVTAMARADEADAAGMRHEQSGA